MQHQSLKHLAYILAKLLCNVICGKIVFIDNVRHKFILNLGAVEQSGCISLINSRHINSHFLYFYTAKIAKKLRLAKQFHI